MCNGKLRKPFKNKKEKKGYLKKLYGIVKKWPKKIKLQIFTEPGHGVNPKIDPYFLYTFF